MVRKKPTWKDSLVAVLGLIGFFVFNPALGFFTLLFGTLGVITVIAIIQHLLS